MKWLIPFRNTVICNWGKTTVLLWLAIASIFWLGLAHAWAQCEDTTKRLDDIEINLAQIIANLPTCGPSGTITCSHPQPKPDLEDCPLDKFHQKCLRENLIR